MNNNQVRIDGRYSEELRSIRIDHDLIKNINFITYSQGLSKVKTSLFQSKDKGQINVNLNFSALARNEFLNDRKIYEMKSKLETIFNDIISSDFQIELNIDVLEDNGSLFSVIVNSITTCLCFCGVSIKDMVLSLTCNDLTDLISNEEKGYYCTVVFSTNLNKILYLQLLGKFQRSNVKDSLNNAISGIEKIAISIRQYLDSVVNK